MLLLLLLVVFVDDLYFRLDIPGLMGFRGACYFVVEGMSDSGSISIFKF